MGSSSAGYLAKPSRKTRWFIVALIVILVLVLNATWAWLYYNKRTDFHNQLSDAKQTAADQKSKNTQLANELADSKQRLAAKDAQKPQSQPVTSDYREIPELGVKYKLTDQTKELTYSYAGDDGIGFSTPELVDFGLKDFPNEPVSTCSASNHAIGNITMYKPGSNVQTPSNTKAGTPVEQFPGAKKVGDNYFIFTSPQAACSKNHTSEESSALKVAKQAFDSLVPLDQTATSQ